MVDHASPGLATGIAGAGGFVRNTPLEERSISRLQSANAMRCWPEDNRMCELHQRTSGVVSRRTLAKFALSSAGLFLTRNADAKEKKPPKPENALSPDAALERLLEGNKRYVEGVTRRHDFKHE